MANVLIRQLKERVKYMKVTKENYMKPVFL